MGGGPLERVVAGRSEDVLEQSRVPAAMPTVVVGYRHVAGYPYALNETIRVLVRTSCPFLVLAMFGVLGILYLIISVGA